MKKRAAVLLTLVSASLTLGTHPVVAQDIPTGVRYKAASDELNSSAKALLETALKNPEKTPFSLFDGAVTCGPTLWMDLKSGAGPVLQESKPVQIFMEVPEVIRTEARAMLNADQRREFWSALTAKYPELASAHVRKASASETRYFWATISFDIEEPFFAIDAGTKKFIANFRVENGNPVLFWFDRVGDFKTMGTVLPKGSADSAAMDAVTELVLPGWKRYSFSYDGGLTVSAMLPHAPEERAGMVRIPSEPAITLMGRTITSASEGISFNIFYTSQLSRRADQLSDQERNSVLAAMAGPWLNGIMKAMKESGKEPEPKSGPMRPTMLGKHAGLEQDILIPPFLCRIRAALVGSYSYGALVVWNSSASETLPQAFFESLRLEN